MIIFPEALDGGGRTMPSLVLEFEHLSKRYGGLWANRDVDLTLESGNIVGILGPNGAGKTTLLRQLVGLSRSTQGHITLNGRVIGPGHAWVKSQIAYLPQHPLALGDLTVEEAIRATALLRGQSWAFASARTQDVMERLDLTPLRNQLVSRLSGGEHRLVGIATIVVAPTPVVALDEPTNELDPLMRHQVWNMIERLKDPSRIILLVSHNVLEAEKVLDRVLIIHHGRIRHDGSPNELRRKTDDALKITIKVALGHERLSRIHNELVQETFQATWQDQTVQFTCPRILALNLLSRWLRDPGLIEQVAIKEPSLEDAYLSLRQNWNQNHSIEEEDL